MRNLPSQNTEGLMSNENATVQSSGRRGQVVVVTAPLLIVDYGSLEPGVERGFPVSRKGRMVPEHHFCGPRNVGRKSEPGIVDTLGLHL